MRRLVLALFGLWCIVGVFGCSEPDQPKPKSSNQPPPTEAPQSQEAPKVNAAEIAGTYKATMVAEKYMDPQEVDFQNQMLNSNGGKSITLGKDNSFEADLSGLKISGHWALENGRISLTPESIGGKSIRELAKGGPSKAVEAAQDQLRPFSVLEVKAGGVLKPVAPSNDTGDKFLSAVVFKRE